MYLMYTYRRLSSVCGIEESESVPKDYASVWWLE